MRTSTRNCASNLPEQLDRDRVVISGTSGMFPNSEHVKDFADILYNKVNPIEEVEHNDFVHPEMIKHRGRIPKLDRFDCQFFKVNNQAVRTMEPMCRKLLEQTYQAIYDAGLSPEHLQGRFVGVYIGSSYAESERTRCYTDFKNGNGVLGGSRALFANRISYFLDLKGPSLSLDQACCSSALALEHACKALRSGEVEAAIVGGFNLCLHPQAMIHYGRVIKLSEDNATRSFDACADGCVSSDAISVLFLQKAKDALRIYADIIHVKSEFNGILENNNAQVYGFLRNPDALADYLRDFYKEAGVPPEAVEYVEAFGAGVLDADEAELKALDQVFCEKRTRALPVGSVTSNFGYTGAVSALVSITKVLLAYQTGQVAGNLHYKNPREDVAAVRDRRIQVVSENQPLNRSYVAVNNLSLNGINAHLLLNCEYRPKQIENYVSSIPHLVLASGRQESAVEFIFNYLKSRLINPEELALLHHIHEKRINGHLSRGYTVLGTEDDRTVCLGEKVERFDGLKRPVWFVYSGLGSQWTGMGGQLMRIPRFAATIQRIHEVLEPRGVDIVDIITTTDKSALRGIFNALLGITSIQIALTDVLADLGIVPDNIIGHSIGELGCGYADGCLTLEEMILSAYYRGRVAEEIPVIKGAMCAVGMGYQKMRDMCPPGIYISCRNGPDSCTLSGPVEDIEKFSKKLEAEGIFVKTVASDDIAFHSPYIAAYNEIHKAYLREVITPRERSARWITSSVPAERAHEYTGRYSCAEYHNNNMMSAVLFEEALQHVPANAILIEIAPHGLLQAILKRSVPSGCCNVPLTQRGHPDNVLFFLRAIGQLYIEGLNPKIANIYPKIEFPVSTETPSLSHLPNWIHDEKWELPLYDAGEKKLAASSKFLISVHDEEYKYLRGCVIRGETVFPFAAALVAAWDVCMAAHGLATRQSVEFRDVQFFSQPILHDQRQICLNVTHHVGSGRFDVSDEFTKVACGYVSLEMPDLQGVFKAPVRDLGALDLNSDDIYNLLQDKGHFYSGEFLSVHRADASLTSAEMTWRDNWVTVIDGLLQLNALKQEAVGTQPSHVRRLCIDMDLHRDSLMKGKGNVLNTVLDDVHDFTRCGGILLESVKFRNLPAVMRYNLELKSPENLVDDDVTTDCTARTTLRSNCNGDLKSLHWAMENEIPESGVKVRVHYAGISDYDLKKVSGTLSLGCGVTRYGMEFSGVTESGERVMGVVQEGALSSSLRAGRELLWDVPTAWTLQDAATVPLAYCLAYYCLELKASLRPGMKILMIGGAGAMGQAVISIALAHGCRVFTTVSNDDKKKLLMQIFPKLNESDIGTSLNASFHQVVMQGTGGKGCDIVISNAVGALKNVALSCCASCGTAIDTALAVTEEAFSFGLKFLKNRRTYICVDFSSIFTQNYTDDMMRLRDFVRAGIRSGEVRPLTRTVYDPEDIALAFESLRARRQGGRLLVRLDNNDFPYRKSFVVTPESNFLVLCDDALGVKIADRLVTSGLRKMHLHCTQPTGYLNYKLQSWKTLGVKVEMSSVDLKDVDNVRNVLTSGQVDGICVAAGESELSDESLLYNLDVASRQLCPHLKYFLVVGSDSTAAESIVHSRIQEKLPGTALSLPLFEKQGYDSNVKFNTLAKVSWAAVADVVESALSSGSGSFVAEVKHATRPTLLDQISSIANIDIKKTRSSKTLHELGVSGYAIQQLRTSLRELCNVSLEESQIRQLTIQRIQDIEDAIVWRGFKQKKGLEMFFSHVNSNELEANNPLVLKQTRAFVKGVDDFDVVKTYLYVIPGLEGQHERFRLLCERLKVPAVVLQPGLGHLQESIQGQARRFTEMLLKKMKLKDNFYFAAYECGVLVALEMLSILENKGYKGTLFCIGVPPEEVKGTIDEHLEGLSADEVHDAIIEAVSNTIVADKLELKEDLEACNSLEEKLEVATRKILNRKGVTIQYAKDLLKSAIGRVEEVRAYEPKPYRYNSKIILLTSESVNTESIHKYSKQNVHVYHLDTPLADLTRDLRCSAVINQHLGPDILAEYEKRNILESYYTNTLKLVFKKRAE